MLSDSEETKISCIPNGIHWRKNASRANNMIPYDKSRKTQPSESQPFYVPLHVFSVSSTITVDALCFKPFAFCCTLSHTACKLLHSMETPDLPLHRFRALKDEKPPCKIVFFRTLYPEITSTLLSGHTLREVHQRLVEDGVEVSYSLLRTYVSRIRREKALVARAPQSRQSPLSVTTAPPTPTVTEDPLANAMRALSKPRYSVREAMCDGDPSKKKLV